MAKTTCLQGKCAQPVVCCCFSQSLHDKQVPIVTKYLHGKPLNVDVNNLIACSIIGGIKQKLSPVCTWVGDDLHDIYEEGCKLARALGSISTTTHKSNQKVIQQYGKKWIADIGILNARAALHNGTEIVEDLEKTLIHNKMCLLHLNRKINHLSSFVIFFWH